jgi:hypothetical protein
MQPTNKGKLKLDLERTTCLCVMDSAKTILSTILIYDQMNSHDTLLRTTAVAMSWVLGPGFWAGPGSWVLAAFELVKNMEMHAYAFRACLPVVEEELVPAELEVNEG